LLRDLNSRKILSKRILKMSENANFFDAKELKDRLTIGECSVSSKD
jgi:hypothetical protein